MASQETRIYLSLDEDSYLKSAYLAGAGVALDLPYVTTLEGFDLSGGRIWAHKWDGDKLIFDADRWAEISVGGGQTGPSVPAEGSAGYMFFYIDENGDLICQQTSSAQVNFYLQDGDLYVEASA